MEWPEIITIAVVMGWSVALFCGRHWIKSSIENSVKHKFDKQIEQLRAELRQNEETFKSQLRTKETEISTLRDSVLMGRSGRQALLDKRRLESVEKVWTALVALAPYKGVSAMMSRIKLDAAAKRVSREASLRTFFGTIVKMAPELKAPVMPVEIEQLYVSPLAWAYLSAYRAIVMHAYMMAKMLEIGTENPTELLNDEFMQNLLKAALPHQAAFINQYKTSGYHHLLDELEQYLMSELQKMLDGADADKANTERALQIMNILKKAEAQTQPMIDDSLKL